MPQPRTLARRGRTAGKVRATTAGLLEDRRGHHGDAEDQLEHSIGVHEEI